MIGLNPPFGKNNALANKFVQHAARFKPRLLVLIVPPDTWVPEGYTTVFEDRAACKGEEFYVPGALPRRARRKHRAPAARVGSPKLPTRRRVELRCNCSARCVACPADLTRMPALCRPGPSSGRRVRKALLEQDAPGVPHPGAHGVLPSARRRGGGAVGLGTAGDRGRRRGQRPAEPVACSADCVLGASASWRLSVVLSMGMCRTV